MEQEIEIELTFPDIDFSDQISMIEDLQEDLLSSLSSHGTVARTSIKKPNQSSQDLGTILAVVLGAKATIAIAVGIANWMMRRNQSRIRLKDQNGREVEITNAESKDIAKILDKLYED